MAFLSGDAYKKGISRCDAFLSTLPDKKTNIREKSIEAVTKGLEHIGRRHRGSPEKWLLDEEITYPYAKFGSLVTADRPEIEGYMAIYRLIRNYYADRKVDRPISIATFGPPAAGNHSRLSPSLPTSIPRQHDHLLVQPCTIY